MSGRVDVRAGWRVGVLAAAALAATLGGCRAQRPAPVATPGLLRVATSGDYAPFSIVNAEGEITGMDIEVAKRLGQDLGVRVEFLDFTWSELTAFIVGDQCDIAMGGITTRADRALAGRFTRPYAETGTVVLVPTREVGSVESLDALDTPGMRIAVNAGGHLERVARARFPNATIDAVADNQAVPQRLKDGEADAAITDTAEVQSWLGPGLRALGPFNVDYKAYLLPAGDAALAQRVDEWIAARERDGWLNDQRLRWIGPDAGMDAAAADRSAVVGLIRLRLELAPAIGAAKRAINLPIEDREQEARVLERAKEAAPDNQARVLAVYRQLIELSKALQAEGIESSITAELPQLRNALSRIDAALVPVVAAATATDPPTWDELLSASITHPAIQPAQLSALAAALSE